MPSYPSGISIKFIGAVRKTDPIKRGLKLLYTSQTLLTPTHIRTVRKTDPIKRGLKLERVNTSFICSVSVRKTDPIKRGLKLFGLFYLLFLVMLG